MKNNDAVKCCLDLQLKVNELSIISYVELQLILKFIIKI